MYPYTIPGNHLEPFPILGDQYSSEPLIFDYTDSYYETLPVRDIEYMDRHNMELLEKSGKTWGIGGYLDDRSSKLRGTHIYEEGRIFHLGIDLMTRGVADIYNPLDGEIFETGYEDGAGNYGGYMIMKCSFGDSTFFALFGHLDFATINKSTSLKAGEKIGTLGTPDKNGNWVPHLHLQVFTGRDLENWKFKGYCTLEDLRHMQYICPHPGFLLRFYI